MKLLLNLGEKDRLDMKALISIKHVLKWKTDEKKIEEKLNRFNIIIKYYGLDKNFEMILTMMFSRNLDTNIRMQLRNSLRFS
jgi:hypothetical protein